MWKLANPRSYDENKGKADLVAADFTQTSQSSPKSNFDEDLGCHRLINSAQLRKILPASQMSIWRWERQGILPKHVVIGGRNYWHLSRVLASIELHSNPDADKAKVGNNDRS